MRKIVYIISSFKTSGVIYQLLGLVKYLDTKEYKPYILTLSNDPPQSLRGKFDQLGIEVISLGSSRMGTIFSCIPKLNEVIKNINPDIVHTHSIKADLLSAVFLRQYTRCNTLHNYVFDEDYNRRFLGKYIAKLHLNIIKRIEYPICCSYSISDKFLSEQTIKTLAIQNGVDDSFYSPANSSRKAQLRKQLKLDHNKKIFVCSGDLSKRKDPLTVIKAFVKANKDKKGILLILGEGPLKKECEALGNDDVVIKGFVSNVRDFLMVSDVYISASYAEGMPMSVLEALGTGLPVILSDILPHQEIIEKNSEIGGVFPCGDVNQLSRIISSYMTSKGDIESKKLICRQIVKENFSAAIMSMKYQDIYKCILNNK